ncbi:Pumilio 2 [Ceratobasidium sp. 414]|nr:Pumilio 2 [Ceratobasidium sp. 414]
MAAPETSTEEEKEAIFSELVPSGLLSLMTGVFGNYVVQKLFEFNLIEQWGHLMYGCRVVQKQVSFVQEIDGEVMRCVKDANGNHGTQTLIERVMPELLGFVLSFQGSVYDLATNPYGRRVLQRCFECLREPQTRPLINYIRKKIQGAESTILGTFICVYFALERFRRPLEVITKLLAFFADHVNANSPFAQNVIQFVLEHGTPADWDWILHELQGQMVQMAKHKFTSNVCEKVLVMADPESRRLLIEETNPRSDVVNPIVLTKDSFATCPQAVFADAAKPTIPIVFHVGERLSGSPEKNGFCMKEVFRLDGREYMIVLNGIREISHVCRLDMTKSLTRQNKNVVRRIYEKVFTLTTWYMLSVLTTPVGV